MAYNLKSIREDFKNKGVFYTPSDLGIFLKSFLPKNVSEIYDPTCGDGALLRLFDDKVEKYGQEINNEQVMIARENLKNFKCTIGDTLVNPGFINKKFDAIIANPPFSIKWLPNKDDIRFRDCPFLPPKSKADYAFILHCLHYLSESGTAVILCFPGILYRGNSEGKIRKWLVDNNFIEKIIYVDNNKFVDTAIATVILVLNKRKKDTSILMIDDSVKKEKYITLEEIKDNDYQLSVNQYIYEDIKKEVIDSKKAQLQAREDFLNYLKKELEFEKLVCEFEKTGINVFLNEIKIICNRYYDK